MAEWAGYAWGTFVRWTWDPWRLWWLYTVCRNFKTGKLNGRYPEGIDE